MITEHKEMIRARAKNLGFSFCSFAPIQQTPHTDIFKDWIRKSYHGEMAYLAKKYVIKGRENPSSLLKNAKTAIVAGLHYRPIEQSGLFKIASYAWYEDYHRVLRDNFKELMAWIKENLSSDLNYRIFIDSGPVMEKDFAASAGLGTIGKNSLFYHQEFGSYVLLGVAFSNLEFDFKPSVSPDLCGDCRLCLEACPANCILENRTIDARKCIAYLTVEKRNLISKENRSIIGEWIYGCDICQTICPLNKKCLSNLNNEPVNLRQVLSEKMIFKDEIKFSDVDYASKYQDSVVQRLPQEFLIQNIVLSIGNQRIQENVAELVSLLQSHPAGVVRASAAWSLGQIGVEITGKTLRGALQNEKEPKVLVEIKNALNQ